MGFLDVLLENDDKETFMIHKNVLIHPVVPECYLNFRNKDLNDLLEYMFDNMKIESVKHKNILDDIFIEHIYV